VLAVSRLNFAIPDFCSLISEGSASRQGLRLEENSYCSYKGDCTYYSIPIAGAKSEYAVWTYEKPYEAVAGIQEHLAFYPTGVDAIEVIF